MEKESNRTEEKSPKEEEEGELKTKDGTRRRELKIERTDLTSSRNDLSLELKVGRDDVGSEEVVRVVLEDQDAVFGADLEDLELPFLRSGAAGRVRSYGHRAAETTKRSASWREGKKELDPLNDSRFLL